MAVHGKNTGVLVGKYDPTSYFTDYTAAMTIEVAETTGFQKQSKEYTVGQSDGTVSFSGRYQGSKSDVELAFERIQDNSDGDPWLVATQGWKAGTRCRMGIGLRTGFDISGSVGDVVGTSMNLQAHKGIQWGWYLGRNAWSAGTPTGASVDTGELGTVSGFADLSVQVHIPTNTLSAAATLKLQQSVDGSTWVDTTAAFTVPAGKAYVGQASLGNPGTGRYFRLLGTLTGTGQAIIHAGIARTI